MDNEKIIAWKELVNFSIRMVESIKENFFKIISMDMEKLYLVKEEDVKEIGF